MDIRSILAQMPMLAQLPEAELQRLAALAEPQYLHSGQRLYAEDDSPDYLYVLASGRLRVTSGGDLLGYVSRLEPVGEMGVITGDSRSATVHAIRDSLLLRIARDPLLELLNRDAPTLMSITRLMLGRLLQYQRRKRRAATGRRGAIAIIPASDNVPVPVLAESLTRQLGGWPRTRLITSRHVNAALGTAAAHSSFSDHQANARLVSWLNQMEERHEYLIYVADNDHDTWTLRCLRQADRVLVLAEASAAPSDIPALRDLPEDTLLAPVELVLLRPEGDPSPQTREWCLQTAARAHYFVHPWSEADLSALARQITGRGVGLVLGGGGARGFAHIGLMRALEQLQIPVDVTGGTSMGAFIAALRACGFDSLEMAHVARETFVNNNFLNDYTVPRVSLIKGNRMANRLREIFGEQRIEDLRRTFYCMSTNLSTGASVAHDHGPLAVWVGTSMSLPGVVPPIAYRGDLLCDGGVVDNLPTDVMQRLERGSIIACGVTVDGDIRAAHAGHEEPDPGALLQWQGEGERPSFGEILMRTATLTADTVIHHDAVERADIYVRMPVQDISIFGWRHLDELIERGYRHALAQLAPLRDSLVD
jgi:NTE family protein